MDNGLMGEGSSDGEESTSSTIIVDLGSQPDLLGAGLDESQEAVDPLTANLINAAKTGNYDVVLGLLERGMDVDSSNEYQQTALMWALKEGHNDVVRLLLERGADIRLKNENEEKAILWAAESANIGGINLLLRRGAEVIDQNGNLFIADMMGDNFLLGEHPEVKACLNAHKAKLEQIAIAMQNYHLHRDMLSDADSEMFLEAKKYSRSDMINILINKTGARPNQVSIVYDQAMDSLSEGRGVKRSADDSSDTSKRLRRR